jgi:hypothetical protein
MLLRNGFGRNAQIDFAAIASCFGDLIGHSSRSIRNLENGRCGGVAEKIHFARVAFRAAKTLSEGSTAPAETESGT